MPVGGPEGGGSTARRAAAWTRLERRLIQELLIGAVQDAPPPAAERWADEVGPQRLYDAAEQHRVTPALARHLVDVQGLDPVLEDSLRRVRKGQLLHNLRTLRDLSTLAAALTGAGIPFVVVKGPVAAATLWPSPEMRASYDLDVIVRPRDLPGAIDALAGLGARQLDLNWSLIARQMRSELSFVLPGRTLLDLHWHPVNDASLRRRLRWSVDEMVERRVEVPLGPMSVPTTDPADTVLHVAYHATHSGGHRLLWLRDVHGACGAAAGHWADVTARAADARLELLVRVAVARAERVLGPTGSPSRWRGWSGGAWGGLLAFADRVRRPPTVGEHPRTWRALHASTRTGAVDSLAALLREAAAHAMSPQEVLLDPNPLHVPDGDLKARADYLREAAREGRRP